MFNTILKLKLNFRSPSMTDSPGSAFTYSLFVLFQFYSVIIDITMYSMTCLLINFQECISLYSYVVVYKNLGFTFKF